MKRVFVFIFGMMFLFSPFRAAAQLLDGLFEEEDFESSEIEKMQKEEAERKKEEAEALKNAPSAEKPVSAPAGQNMQTGQNPPAVQSVPVSAAAAPAPTAANQPVPATSAQSAAVKNQQTFDLLDAGPQKMRTPSLPLIGSGKAPVLPDLGSKAGRREDENLSLFEMRAKKTGASDTNVLKFDIAGIRLKMTPEEVMERALSAGFSVKFQDRKIPTLNEWKYRRLCMQQMLFKYDIRKRCVQEIAQYNNSEYVSRLVFENKDRRETLTVEFASRFAENQAYRIRYVSKGDHSLGTTDEAHYFKTKRRQEFLKLLVTKYGIPDDEQALLWGVSGVSATLQADLSDSFLDASLVLEDLSIENEDFDNMSVQDAKNPSIEKFSF